MKIGIFSSLATYGGVQSCVISLVKGLNELGLEPTLLSDRPLNQMLVKENGLRLAHQAIRYSVSRRTAEKLSPLLRGAMDLAYFYRASWLESRFDFLYVFHPNILVDVDTDHLYYLSMCPRAPGYSGSELRSRAKFWIYDHFIRSVLPIYEFKDRAERCVINSEYTAAYFHSTFQKSLTVVYPPTFNSCIQKSSVLRKDKIVFLSRLAPAKRPELFIELAKRFPGEKFLLVGGTDDESYVKRLREMIDSEAVDNVELRVNVSNEDVAIALGQAKFYVFPSRNEHFGITTVEAMAHGAIPFVHNSGGQREIVPWEQLRFDDGEMADKFQVLLSLDAEEIERLKRSMATHIEKFSEQTYISRMLSFLPRRDPLVLEQKT